MTRFVPLLLSAFTLSVFALSSAAFAQTPTRPTPTPATTQPAVAPTLENQIAAAERNQNSDALLILYGQAITTPEGARAAIGRLLSSYYTLRNQAQTADQATQAVSEALLRFQVLQSAQNQILIQQNQQILQQNARIIALLEQGARVPNAATVPPRTAPPR